MGIPTGLLIAWLARDELIDGFSYLRALTFIAFTGVVISSFFSEVIALSLGFVSIAAYISVLKRFDAKWTVERKR